MDKALLNQLYRYAISLTGDGDEAYDLLQQAVERFLRQPKNKVQVSSAYLMRSIRNLFFDQVRHRHLHLVVSEQLQQDIAEPEHAPPIADLLIHRQDVEQLMTGLSCHDRELLYLWAVEEYTVQEIADMRSAPRGTILSQLHRLKKKLRSQLSEQQESARRVHYET